MGWVEGVDLEYNVFFCVCYQIAVDGVSQLLVKYLVQGICEVVGEEAFAMESNEHIKTLNVTCWLA